MVVACTCRICKTEYRSLLVATSCCQHLKMKRKRVYLEIRSVQETDRQSKLGEFHHHNLDWKKLISELRELGYSAGLADTKSE